MTTKNWAELRKRAEMPKGGFEPLPIGTWPFVVVKSTAQKSQDGTKDQISQLLKIESGPHEGATGFRTMTLSPDNDKALGFWFGDLATFGLGDDFWEAHPEAETSQIAPLLVGHRCLGKVAEEMYNGEKRTKITYINPPADGVQPPLPATLPAATGLDGGPIPGVPGGALPAGGLGMFAPPVPGTPDPWATGAPAPAGVVPPPPETPF